MDLVLLQLINVVESKLVQKLLHYFRVDIAVKCILGDRGPVEVSELRVVEVGVDLGHLGRHLVVL